MQKYVDQLTVVFRKNADSYNAPRFESYMKNNFVFYGVMTPKRNEILKEWRLTLPKNRNNNQLWKLVEILWEKEEREFQYVAIEFLKKWDFKTENADFGEKLKFIITQKSWWDSVDLIASHTLAHFFKTFPEEGKKLIEEWRHSDNLWQNRSCLIFQLFFREKTDTQLLESLILQYKNRPEFFIQKAIGWSLRQYARTDAMWVQHLVKKLEITGLAKREAEKHFEKYGLN